MNRNDSDDDAQVLPRHTTPTWEVELLISGIAVFAMLQLPDLLDRVILEWAPRFVDRWQKLLWLVFIYAKSAALILATTFVIHLVLRARWIALVGMRSIYPAGVDWSNLRLGPNAREFEQRRFGRIEDTIERADNRATMLFALGVVLASVLCVVALVATVVVGSVWLLESATGVQPTTHWVLWLMGVVLLPYLLALGIDRRHGERFAHDGLARRLVRTVLSFYARIGMGPASNPALALLASHRGRRRTAVLTTLVFLFAILAATSSYYFARVPQAFGDYRAFPDGDDAPAHSVDTAHYDDRRDPRRDPPVAYIQSAVILGPYVQLVVPFEPDRDGPAMEGHCPRATGADARLACLQALRGIALDGKPVDVRYDIGRDARTERPALVAMLDVRALPPGRHALRIARPLRLREGNATPTDAADPKDPGHLTIPFWR